MTAIANFVGLHFERPTPLLTLVVARVGRALRRAARGRYAEQSERIARTGLAGVI